MSNFVSKAGCKFYVIDLQPLICCSLQVLNSNNLFWSKKLNTCSKKGDYFTKLNTCKDMKKRVLKESKLFMKLSISVHFWVLRLMPVTVAFCVSFSGQDRCWRSVVHPNCVVLQSYWSMEFKDLDWVKSGIDWHLKHLSLPQNETQNKVVTKTLCKVQKWVVYDIFMNYLLSFKIFFVIR